MVGFIWCVQRWWTVVGDQKILVFFSVCLTQCYPQRTSTHYRHANRATTRYKHTKDATKNRGKIQTKCYAAACSVLVAPGLPLLRASRALGFIS